MDHVPGTVVTLKPESLTWDTALRLFLLRCRSQNVAKGTLGLYTWHLGGMRRSLEAQGALVPADTAPAHLRSHLEARRARGNKPTTVDCVYRIMRTFWAFLHRDGLVLVDPMTKVERPRRERRFAKPVTEEQLKLLLEAIDTDDVLGQRDHALMLFLADTGLRITEALSLNLGDLDWTSGSAVVLGKGGKERRVAFGQVARKVLTAWLQRRGAAESQDPLWVNRYGNRMRRDNFRQRMKVYSKRAGIATPRLSPHALRHFFALAFLKNGGDAMSLQKLLGHSSLEMVRNYVNMTDDEAIARHRSASPLDKLGPLPGERKRVRLK